MVCLVLLDFKDDNWAIVSLVLDDLFDLLQIALRLIKDLELSL